MSNYELSLTAGEIDIALQKASSPDTSPQNTDNLVTSQGIKTYVDTAVATLTTQIAAVESELQNTSTGVSFERVSEFSTSSESYQSVPLSVKGQPDYFTNNGNNTYTLLGGNYLMWLNFNWKTRYGNYTSNELNLQLTTLSGMANFAGIGVFVDRRDSYAADLNKTTLLNANFKNVNQTTTFALQIKDTASGSGLSVYVKDVTLTILKV